MSQNQTQNKTIKIHLYQIAREPALQAREAMSPKKVADYQQAYNNGTEFPPLLVARQTDENGTAKYRLLDGWHRIQALENNGTSFNTKVAVNIIDVPQDINIHKLRYLGGRENVKNGLGLTAKDKRVLFINYVRGQFNKEGHSYKSYRKIAADLSLIPHQTVARWMKSEFPAIAKLMSKEHEESDEVTKSTNGIGARLTTMPDLSSRERDIFSSTLLEEAKAGDNEMRNNIINWARSLLEKLEKEAPSIEPTPQVETTDNDRF